MIKLVFERTGSDKIDNGTVAPHNTAGLLGSMVAYIMHSPTTFSNWRSWAVQQAMMTGEHKTAAWLRKIDRTWLAWIGQQLLDFAEEGHGHGDEPADAARDDRGDGPEAG